MIRIAKLSALARPAARAANVTPPRLRFTTRAAAQKQRHDGSDLQAAPSSNVYGVARRPLAVNDLFFPAQVGSIFRDIEQELARAWGGDGPGLAAKAALGQVDIKETKEAFVFKLDVPGMTKQDISVKVTPDNVLVISGERKAEEESESDGFFRRERAYGKFSRSFQLPEKAVDTGKISAKVAHGELSLTVPKRQPEPEPEAQEIQIE